MKQFLLVIVAVVSIAIGPPAAVKASSPGSQDRVTICHKPGTPAEKTLTLPLKAAARHILSHGDTLGACPGQPIAIVIPREAVPISGPSFNTVAEASRYVAEKIVENSLGEVQLERSSVGEIVGVGGNTASAVQDTILVTDSEGGVEELDRFSTVLGGLQGFITVGGEKICLRDEGCGICAGGDFDPELGCICPSGFEVVAGDCRLQEPVIIESESISALQIPPISDEVEVCDQDLLDAKGQPLFCTQNKSFKTNFFFYKSIGSETKITRGGVSYGPCECLLPIEGGCFLDVQICSIIGPTALTLSQAYFGTFPPTFDNPTVVDTRFKSAISTNRIESKHWRLFVNITTECSFANRCNITGVCASHGSRTEQAFGIGDTQAVTTKGNVGEDAPDCRF